MSIRILHMADAHLGAPLTNFGEYAGTRRDEQEASFRRAIEAAIAERVQAVVVAGDLFDTWRPDVRVVSLVTRELGRLREAGIKAFGVPGTHDSLAFPDCVYRSETLPFHRFFTDPIFGEPDTLEIEGVRVSIYGIAYDRERSGDGWGTLSRRREGGIHVAVVHAACRVHPDWPIDPEDMPFREADLSGFGMDYVALGHYHNTHLFQVDGRIVGGYSGSLEGRDWTEPGPRHVLLVEWDAVGAPRVRPIAVQTRVLDSREVDVSAAADPEALVRAVAESCPPGPLWSVTLRGEPEIVPRPESIASALEATYRHVRIQDATTLVTTRWIAERCEEETVRGEFFRRLVTTRESAVGERARVVADRAIKLGLRIFG